MSDWVQGADESPGDPTRPPGNCECYNKVCQISPHTHTHTYQNHSAQFTCRTIVSSGKRVFFKYRKLINWPVRQDFAADINT